MAIIRIRRSTGTSAPGNLKTGELAYAMGTGTTGNAGDRLFFGKGDDGSGNATTIVVVGGEYFTNMLDHVHGTMTANSAIIVDGDQKIDRLNVDNVRIDGNTVSTTNTGGNLILSPNGTGTVDVDTSKITSLVDPTADQDAATKIYVDTNLTGKTLTVGADSGANESINLSSGVLLITGGQGLETTTSADQINIEPSPITLGTSTPVNLGQTLTDITGLTSLSVDNIFINGNTIQSTDGSNVLYIDPAPTDSDGGDLIIRGNLTVQGKQTIINSTTMSINDLNLVLADSAQTPAAADGAGITINGANATILYNGATDRFDHNKGINFPGDVDNGNTIYFNGVKIVEALQDHFANNTFLAGDGIDITYNDSSNTMTFAGELATLTNRGVASFGGYADSDETIRQFSVTSGNVRIEHIDGGTF